MTKCGSKFGHLGTKDFINIDYFVTYFASSSVVPVKRGPFLGWALILQAITPSAKKEVWLRIDSIERGKLRLLRRVAVRCPSF